MRYALLAAVLMVLAAGCVGQDSTGAIPGLEITLTADPDDIHYNEVSTLYIDMENKGSVDFAGISYSLFDTGILAPASQGCSGFANDIRPGKIISAECILKLKDDLRPEDILVYPVAATKVKFRAVTQNMLQTTAVLKMLSQDEWRRQLTTGTLQQEQGTFAIRDGNLQMSIVFTKEMPFVETVSGSTVLFKIEIENIGSGYIDEIMPQQLIKQQGNLAECDFSRRITPLNKKFPPIFCTLSADTGGLPSANYAVTFTLNYNYEAREEVSITVRR